MKYPILSIKKLFSIGMIILIAICLTPPIAIEQVYIGEDMLYHYLRVQELSNNIFNGSFFPTIYSKALGGYGYASGIFYPDLMLIIPALFYKLGLPVNISIDLYLFLVNVATITIATYCANDFLSDKNIRYQRKYAFLLGILYAFYPYRLYNIFYRGALSEFIAMTFIPLALLSLYRIFLKKDYSYWKMLSVSFTLLLLTHLVSTLILGIIGIIFLVCNYRNLKNKYFLKSMIKACGYAILASLFFLAPMLEQMADGKFLYSVLPHIKDINLNPNQIIYEKAFKLLPETISPVIPIVLTIAIVLLTIYLYRLTFKASNLDLKYKYVIISVIYFIDMFLILTNLFPWEIIVGIIPIIKHIQFPFRLFMLGGFAFSIIIIFSLPSEFLNSRKILLLLLGILMLSPNLIVGENLLSKNESIDKSMLKYIDNTWCVGFGEYIPAKVNIPYKDTLKNRGSNTLVIKDINNNIISSYKAGIKKFNAYTINTKNIPDKAYKIELPLLYYKGYSAKINDKYTKVYQSDDGLVELKLANKQNGNFDIQVIYSGTHIQKLSRVISVFFICLILFRQLHSLHQKKYRTR